MNELQYKRVLTRNKTLIDEVNSLRGELSLERAANTNLHERIKYLKLEKEAHEKALQGIKEVPFLRQIIQYLTVANADLASALNSRVEIVNLDKRRGQDGNL